MPRLTPIASKSDVPAAHQGVVDDVMKVFGRIRGPYSMLLHAPNLAKKLLPLVPFFREECMVEAPLRSLAIITAVRECEAAYVWAAQVGPRRETASSPRQAIEVVKSKGDPGEAARRRKGHHQLHAAGRAREPRGAGDFRLAQEPPHSGVDRRDDRGRDLRDVRVQVHQPVRGPGAAGWGQATQS